MYTKVTGDTVYVEAGNGDTIKIVERPDGSLLLDFTPHVEQKQQEDITPDYTEMDDPYPYKNGSVMSVANSAARATNKIFDDTWAYVPYPHKGSRYMFNLMAQQAIAAGFGRHYLYALAGRYAKLADEGAIDFTQTDLTRSCIDAFTSERIG